MSSEHSVEVMTVESMPGSMEPNRIMSVEANKKLTKKQMKRAEYEKTVSENIVKNNLKVKGAINEYIEHFLSSVVEVEPHVIDLFLTRWKDKKNQVSIVDMIQDNKLKSKLKTEEEIQHNIIKNEKKQDRLQKEKTKERIEKIKQRKIEKNLSKCKKYLQPGNTAPVSKYDRNTVKKLINMQITAKPSVEKVQPVLSSNAKPFIVEKNEAVVTSQPISTKLSPDAKPFNYIPQNGQRFKSYYNNSLKTV